MNIILTVSFAPIVIILYFMLRSDAKAKRNIVLGITLPFAARESEEVKALCAKYKRVLGICSLIVLILIAPAYFFQYTSVALTYIMTWLLFAIVAIGLVYAAYNRRLKLLKAERGWFSAYAGVTLVDIAAVERPKRLSLWIYLPPFLLSLLPIALELLRPNGDAGYALVYGSLAITIPLFAFFGWAITRQRADVTDEKTELTLALTNVRRYNWSIFMALAAWLTGVFATGLYFMTGDPSVVRPIALSLTFVLAMIGVAMYTEFKTRRAQEKLTESTGQEAFADEDAHWIYGMFYHNPNDSHFLINNRVGLGMTMNFAKPGGKVLALFSALIMLSLPFMGLWMMDQEFTPVALKIQDERLLALHTGEAYSIPLSQIESAELIETLPGGTRVAGTSLGPLQKGRYSLAGIGACRINLNAETPPYIVLKAGGETYVINSADAEETTSVFNALPR